MIKKHNFFEYPGYILFFLMLFAPISYKSIKVVFIIIVLAVILISIALKKTSRIPLHKTVLALTFFYTCIGLFFTLIGSFKGAPGAIAVSTVHVIWPWLYLLFILGLNKKKFLISMLKVMVFSTLLIELYALSYVLSMKGIIPNFLYVELDLGQNIGFYSGYTEFALNSIGSLVFLLPFTFAALCVWKSEKEIPIRRVWLWLSLILGLLVLMLSGRRAFILTTALSPFFLIILVMFFPKIRRKAISSSLRRLLVLSGFITIFGFLYLKIVMDYDFSGFQEMVYSAFDFNDHSNESSYLRLLQTHALINGWGENPFLGAGLGAKAELIRSEEQPWAYELQYLAYLFQTGLVGIISYACGLLWIFIQGIRMIRVGKIESIMITPLLVGLACFLLANASNPYLSKYDYLWVIFLPIAYINYWLINQPVQLDSEETSQIETLQPVKRRKFKRYKIN
ncbi:hypothetical protein CN540_31255 [Bacillus toyonensis]|uniref:O-antigen ligase family protein n=1 Tax=Bacillus toyonensis TaxID=155322 RepID=UPI000BEF23F6|nr:O-antigen ligase family protein [Bacillus toyonensis]PEN43548.1 hypothetical protein CN540_31255 [Bacillus toyonensis]